MSLTIETIASQITFAQLEELIARKLINQSIQWLQDNDSPVTHEAIKQNAIEDIEHMYYEPNIKNHIDHICTRANFTSKYSGKVDEYYDPNNLGLEDYSGWYIVDANGGYVDGPFDDHRTMRHEWDIHPNYIEYHSTELTDEEYRQRWFDIVR